jgi:hypothetical protein
LPLEDQDICNYEYLCQSNPKALIQHNTTQYNII